MEQTVRINKIGRRMNRVELKEKYKLFKANIRSIRHKLFVVKTKIKCSLGTHTWKRPITAQYKTFWAQVGDECVYCKKFQVSRNECTNALEYAYRKGTQDENTRMIAYAHGLPEILQHYPNAPLKYGYIKVREQDEEKNDR